MSIDDSSSATVTSRTAQLLDRRKKAIPRGVGHMTKIVADHAEGSYLVDVDGRRFIDFSGGIGTLNIGHRHPAVMTRIREQLDKLHHVAIGVALTEPYIEVAERLLPLVPIRGDKKAILLNSGAEAVENAIKIARAYTKRRGIVCFEGAFHGRTLMTMTLSSKANPYKTGFGSFAPDVYRVPYAYCYRCSHADTPDRCPLHAAEPLQRLFSVEVDPSEVAAVIVEPVQGEGGFVVPPPEFLRAVQSICRSHGVLLIADEIQTGFGRTGKMFACESVGIEPDLLCIGKSLADGLPLSAVVGRAEVMDGPIPGSLGGTYTGNPISCAAALGVLDAFETEGILDSAQRLGNAIRAHFSALQQKYALIGDVRTLGAMGAIELVRSRKGREPAKDETQAVLEYCHAHGLLLIKAGMWDNVIRVLMPLNIPDKALEDGFKILDNALANVHLHNSHHERV